MRFGALVGDLVRSDREKPCQVPASVVVVAPAGNHLHQASLRLTTKAPLRGATPVFLTVTCFPLHSWDLRFHGEASLAALGDAGISGALVPGSAPDGDFR